MADPFPLEPSLWAATAPPAPPTPPLAESVATDVCIVGGGYLGLSTALHLAERGTKVVVLEAKEPGFGGSGRNGGQVIPGLKFDPDELLTMFGPERGAQVTADRVVLATNGYTDGLWPGLRRTIIAANSFQIATRPLSDNLRKSILPGGQANSDSRRIGLYYRLDHTGRFLIGGRGRMAEPDHPRDWQHLLTMMGKMFPQLRDAGIEFRWSGRVALTRDHLPHLHEPAPGLLIDIGCMGRGVALQSALGRAIASYFSTGNAAALPLSPTPLKPLPFHALNRLYLAAFINWYRLRDRLDAA
jgi:glycine/D-amino acid oxidase-like deaminating enzyme